MKINMIDDSILYLIKTKHKTNVGSNMIVVNNDTINVYGVITGKFLLEYNNNDYEIILTLDEDTIKYHKKIILDKIHSDINDNKYLIDNKNILNDRIGLLNSYSYIQMESAYNPDKDIVDYKFLLDVFYQATVYFLEVDPIRKTYTIVSKYYVLFESFLLPL